MKSLQKSWGKLGVAMNYAFPCQQALEEPIREPRLLPGRSETHLTGAPNQSFRVKGIRWHSYFTDMDFGTHDDLPKGAQ